jgi:hypothetical protein
MIIANQQPVSVAVCGGKLLASGELARQVRLLRRSTIGFTVLGYSAVNVVWTVIAHEHKALSTET